jgi:hypothetical protein
LGNKTETCAARLSGIARQVIDGRNMFPALLRGQHEPRDPRVLTPRIRWNPYALDAEVWPQMRPSLLALGCETNGSTLPYNAGLGKNQATPYGKRRCLG